MTTDTTRDAFEAECRRYWGKDRCPDLEFKDDTYTGGRPALAYAFWQAGTAQGQRQPLTDAKT